jgi:hypothetical protein
MADMVTGLNALTGHGATTSHGEILKLKQKQRHAIRVASREGAEITRRAGPKSSRKPL